MNDSRHTPTLEWEITIKKKRKFLKLLSDETLVSSDEILSLLCKSMQHTITQRVWKWLVPSMKTIFIIVWLSRFYFYMTAKIGRSRNAQNINLIPNVTGNWLVAQWFLNLKCFINLFRLRHIWYKLFGIVLHEALVFRNEDLVKTRFILQYTI